MKALFQEAGIPVAPYGVLRAWEAREQDDTALRFIEANIGYPCFVKPANGGSSVGVSRAESREDMGPALGMAFDYDDKAVVEAAVNGREVEVSVLGNEHPEASVAGEVIPDRTFYDYESKYAASSTTRLVIPAGLPNDVSQRVRDLALRTYQVMGCEGYARVDFFVTADNTVIANEVNTIPGFTSISMYPKLWAASGLEYADLLTRILDLALERHERENRS
ncbi:MAG: D-alanine--D-alanine ligase, partial [Dehalococcoidia bacterium]|nr:D-alanine--D-alanine ligase [Dehalococcoidia bacterium]